MDLVTLEQAKRQLRIEDSLHDAEIEFKIQAASAAILNYLKYALIPPEEWLEGSPLTVTVPADIQDVCLMVVSESYHNRETSVVNIISNGFVALLDRHRDPALA